MRGLFPVRGDARFRCYFAGSEKAFSSSRRDGMHSFRFDNSEPHISPSSRDLREATKLDTLPFVAPVNFPKVGVEDLG